MCEICHATKAQCVLTPGSHAVLIMIKLQDVYGYRFRPGHQCAPAYGPQTMPHRLCMCLLVSQFKCAKRSCPSKRLPCTVFVSPPKRFATPIHMLTPTHVDSCSLCTLSVCVMSTMPRDISQQNSSADPLDVRNLAVFLVDVRA